MKKILDDKNISKIFVISALFFGFIIMMLIPPFQVPDEAQHFEKAYVMSQGKFNPENHDGKIGFYIPSEIVTAVDEYTHKVFGNRDEKISYSSIILDDRLPKDYVDYQFVNFSTASSNNAVHIIPAIGILSGKVVAKITQGGHASVVYLLYFARFSNLMMYVILVGLAIKLSPILKKTMLLVGIMPQSLFMGASVSYDSLMIAMSFISLGVIFKLIFDEQYKLNIKNMLILALFAVIYLVSKPIYLPLFLLLFFIPKNKFNDTKHFMKMAGIFALMILGGYILTRIPGYFIKSVTTGVKSGNIVSLTGQQIAYLKAHPLAFFKAVYVSFFGNLPYYISTMVATFGLIDTYVPQFICYLYLLLIIVTGIVEMSNCQYEISWQLRISSVLCYVISFLGIFFAMYLTWAPQEVGVGSDLITGIQGRYFIPALFLPVIVFKNSLLRKNKYINSVMELYNTYFMAVAYAILMVCIMFIVIRFWI
jgi:uncharacterized membrane protein